MSRFFITNTGVPALGPLDTQPGDVLAIIPGGKVPYVLRKRLDSELEGSYTFVGECYVHGVMDGQLLQDNDFPGFSEIWLG